MAKLWSNAFVPKRWLALLAITASLCTIYLTNPALLVQTFGKIDINVGNEKSTKLVNSETRELFGNV